MGELKGFRVGPDRGRGNVRVYKLYISIDFDAHCLTGESYHNQCSVDGQSGLGSTVAACALALPPSRSPKSKVWPARSRVECPKWPDAGVKAGRRGRPFCPRGDPRPRTAHVRGRQHSPQIPNRAEAAVT
jgi:hypothetical protein